MKLSVSLFRTFVYLGLARAANSSSCTELNGIVEGGGVGLIDLSRIKVSLATEAFNLTNPIIPTVAVCSNGLEASVTIRNLLGTYDVFTRCKK